MQLIFSPKSVVIFAFITCVLLVALVSQLPVKVSASSLLEHTPLVPRSEFIREHLLRALILTNEIWQRENETVNKEIASSVLDPLPSTPRCCWRYLRRENYLVRLFHDWQASNPHPSIPSFPGCVFNFPFVRWEPEII